MDAHTGAVDNDNNKKYQHYDTAYHAKRFAHTGENKVRMLAGEHRGIEALLHTGESAGGQGHFTLGGLPCDTVAVGVDGGVIWGDKALLLIVFQKVCPQQGNRRRHHRAAQSKPVEPDPHSEDHGKEDAHDDCCGAKVRGDADDQNEDDAEVARHLDNGEEGVEILILFKIGHLFGGDHNINDLDDLRGLDADACEADPALVAGAVILTEDDQRHQKQKVDDTQHLPLLAQEVRVYNRQRNEGCYAQSHGEQLDDNELGRVGERTGLRHAHGGHIYDSGTEKRTDYAHTQQENIRPLNKLLYKRFKLTDFMPPRFL